MHGEEEDDDAKRPTALLERDTLRGLIDKTVEPRRTGPHTVPREQVRARGSSRHIEVVHVSELQRRPARDDRDQVEPTLSPWLVLGVIALLLIVFIAATQLR